MTVIVVDSAIKKLDEIRSTPPQSKQAKGRWVTTTSSRDNENRTRETGLLSCPGLVWAQRAITQISFIVVVPLAVRRLGGDREAEINEKVAKNLDPRSETRLSPRPGGNSIECSRRKGRMRSLSLGCHLRRVASMLVWEGCTMWRIIPM